MSQVRALLGQAVAALGGQERPGQVAMADAVERAFTEQEHLLVQAGTGTGKSLAYLVPALLHSDRVVVATATLALQHQLVARDIPAVLDAIGDDLPGRPEYAVVKGRANYACLHRVREGVPDEQGALLDAPEGSLGEEVVALREWVEEQAAAGETGEKDHAPRHSERAWRQVSVNHRECLGASKCAFAEECFAERARDRAATAQLVVTNHTLLAIDAIEGLPMLPEYDAVVVDEAHELTNWATRAATDELTASQVERAASRAGAWSDEGEADDLTEAADALRGALDGATAGRLDQLPEALGDALALVRDAARACSSAFPRDSEEAAAGLTQAKAQVAEVFSAADRMAQLRESDVLWVEEAQGRAPARLCAAPLEVRGPLRDQLLARNTTVMTSATLMIGGDFAQTAGSVGLRNDDRVTEPVAPPGQTAPDGGTTDPDPDPEPEPATGTGAGSAGPPALPWRGVDVGSPFDYARQGILYVARHLPPPGRDGLHEQVLDEIASLVDAADGRTLGLFSSRRAAETAAEAMRDRLGHLTVLAQGEAQMSQLRDQFVADPHTCLFGTLGLWQGFDVPGDTCQLVIIDRIPFPRPDDPLSSARQRAADKAGGNGFMQVAASHAALLLAQGSGRLIRTAEDRGVVAVLDPRLATARYGGFLAATLPPMWRTTDPALVQGALRRLRGG